MPLSSRSPSLAQLDAMIADTRYRDRFHPDHSAWIEAVTKGFQARYPDAESLPTYSPAAPNDAGMPGRIHVKSYTRYVAGQPVNVSEYDRDYTPGFGYGSDSGAKTSPNGEGGASPDSGPATAEAAADNTGATPLVPVAGVTSIAECVDQQESDWESCRQFIGSSFEQMQCWRNANIRYSECINGGTLTPLFGW